jgi:flagellar hook-associated protein 3 FlgL
MITENAVRHMSENAQRLLALQEKIASGKEFQRPSDNPSGMAAAFNLHSSLEANRAYLETSQVTEEWMAATDLALKGMVEVAKRAIQLTTQGVSDSYGQTERAALASELNELLAQAVEIGNSTHQGSFLFNGYQTNSRPFAAIDSDGDGVYDLQYNCNATTEVILRSIGPGQTIPQNIDGRPYFEPFFTALKTAHDALLGGNSTQIQASLGGLQTAAGTVSEASTVNGARQRQVRQIKERLEKTQIELKSLLSQKEDINLAEAIANLRNQETAYQSVLEVGQRAISALNLFDMLR